MDILLKGISFEQRLFTNASKSSRAQVFHELRIVRVLGGQAHWAIGGARFAVSSDDWVLLSNKSVRTLLYIEPPEPFLTQVLSVAPEFLFSLGLLPMFDHLPEGMPPVIRGNNQELNTLFDRIHQEQSQGQLHARLVMASLALTVLALLARRQGLSIAPEAPAPGILAVLAEIEARFCGPLGLDELAALACMSREAFARQFKKHTGLSCGQYIKRKRIAKAVALIESTDATILSIALDCGYETLANFYKAFRSATGKTPSEYRHGIMRGRGR